jgi:hypothetical protein
MYLMINTWNYTTVITSKILVWKNTVLGTSCRRLSINSCVWKSVNICLLYNYLVYDQSLGSSVLTSIANIISNQVGNNTNTSYVTYIKKVLTHQVVVCYV